MMTLMALIAMREMLLRWKKPQLQLFLHWLKDILYLRKLVKIRMTLCGSSQQFKLIWCKFTLCTRLAAIIIIITRLLFIFFVS